MAKLTKGEYRVGIPFNTSGHCTVAQIKRMVADLIDLIETITTDGETDQYIEVSRLKALAQTAIEDGAMWAVKAATKRAPE